MDLRGIILEGSQSKYGEMMGLAKDEMLLRIKRLKNLHSWVMPDGKTKYSSVPLTQTGIWATCQQEEGKRMGLIFVFKLSLKRLEMKSKSKNKPINFVPHTSAVNHLISFIFSSGGGFLQELGALSVHRNWSWP